MSEVKRTDEWRDYVQPCSANGVEHDCTYDYVTSWPVELFEAWLAEVIRDAKHDGWVEGHAAHPYFGVNPYEKEEQ